MRLFFDTSALAKRYIAEPGTETVLERCREAREVILSVICAPELISTFNRLRREHKLSDEQYRTMKKDIAADLVQATIVPLTEAVLEKTIAALQKAPLRTLDALHVAAALESSSDLFVSADRRQCKAAREMGLNVEEIESH